MVAITGALAVDNVDSDADIDYLIVTAPRRVWLARSLSIALVYKGRLEHIEICPNYVISIDALDQFDRSFFSAHELAQMVPLHGFDVYDRLLHANRWARSFLPNAFDAGTPKVPRPTGTAHTSRIRQRLKQGTEHLLDGRLGDLWEHRQRTLKIPQLSAEAAYSEVSGAAFTPQRCKGHIDNHSSHIQQAYTERLRRLGVDLPKDWRHAAPLGQVSRCSARRNE
jgi:hypothetical protein